MRWMCMNRKWKTTESLRYNCDVNICRIPRRRKTKQRITVNTLLSCKNVCMSAENRLKNAHVMVYWLARRVEFRCNCIYALKIDRTLLSRIVANIPKHWRKLLEVGKQATRACIVSVACVECHKTVSYSKDDTTKSIWMTKHSWNTTKCVENRLFARIVHIRNISNANNNSALDTPYTSVSLKMHTWKQTTISSQILSPLSRRICCGQLCQHRNIVDQPQSAFFKYTTGGFYSLWIYKRIVNDFRYMLYS